MAEKITGTLTDWRKCPGCWGRDEPHYHGKIYGDANRRFDDGTEVRTSPLVSGPDEAGIIKTKNSTYKLA